MSLRNFRPLWYSSRDGHAEGEHVNRGTDTPSFCPTLQVLDMSTLGDVADVNPVIKFLPHTCNVCGRNRRRHCQRRNQRPTAAATGPANQSGSGSGSPEESALATGPPSCRRQHTRYSE